MRFLHAADLHLDTALVEQGGRLVSLEGER
jgi:DNA repair exonuclease SbcCD nuclease subunit